MKKSIILILVLFITAVATMITLQGCSKEDTLTPQEFAPPSNLRALSQSGAVILYWTRSSSDGGSDFTGYRVMTYLSGVKFDSTVTTQDTARISGMTNGSTYRFKICSVKSNGDISITDSLDWGPTERFISARIYEIASSNPSGFAFANATPYSMTHASPDNRPYVDIYLDTVGTSVLVLRSASHVTSSTGWRATKIRTTDATSLEQQVNFDPSQFSETSINVVALNTVYLASTQDLHYARFQVVGMSGTAPNRYIDIVTAYNSGLGVWAKK